MLVLSRKLNESIQAGNVKITVVQIKGGRVKLGLSAPDDMPIHREELLDLEFPQPLVAAFLAGDDLSEVGS